MLRRRNDKTPPLSKSKLERRVGSLPPQELIPWAEQCLVGGGRALMDYERDREQYHLDEAQLAGEALLAVVGEIRRRGLSVAW